MIFAICGNGMHAGKDTAADFIQEYIDDYLPTFPVHRDAFAREMKLFVAKVLGVNPDLSREETIRFIDELKECGTITAEVPHSTHGHEYTDITGRDLIRNIAEGARDQFGTNFWVDKVDWRAPGFLIISDLRFDTEAEKIQEKKLHTYAKIIEIHRPFYARNDGHVSENGLDRKYIDKVVVNDGSLDDFRAKIRAYVREVLTKFYNEDALFRTTVGDKIPFGE